MTEWQEQMDAPWTWRDWLEAAGWALIVLAFAFLAYAGLCLLST